MNNQHFEVLTRSIEAQSMALWNQWRAGNPTVQPDLSGAILLDRPFLFHANLSNADLSQVVMLQANLNGANLRHANLQEAVLLEPLLIDCDFYRADLSRACCTDAAATRTNFTKAVLRGTILSGTNFQNAVLRGADLTESVLTRARLLKTDLSHANLTGSYVYGISTWDVTLRKTKQLNLVVSEIAGIKPDKTKPSGITISTATDPAITVDSLEMTQFVHLLMCNEKLRDVIDMFGRKAVLILGPFGERKHILEAMRAELRRHDYLPIVFDFDRPRDRDLTETVATLAQLSRFIVADFTCAKSVPFEMNAIVPNHMVPFVAIIERGDALPRLFHNLRTRHRDWVLKPLMYESEAQLRERFLSHVIEPANERLARLRRLKAEKPSFRDPSD